MLTPDSQCFLLKMVPAPLIVETTFLEAVRKTAMEQKKTDEIGDFIRVDWTNSSVPKS